MTLAVLGAGSWGSALACLTARNGHRTLLWGHRPEVMAQMATTRANPRYLPGVTLPEALEPRADLDGVLAEAQHLLLVIPSHAFRDTLEQVKAQRPDLPHLAWATKGLESGSRKLLHRVVAEVFGEGQPCAVVSGPTFAMEVARGLPTALTVASGDAAVAHRYADLMHGETLRAYTSSDMIGVEVGGAAKNVLAIAAGIADGLGFGANTRAALITRGLTEISRLGVALGGQAETFMGLAGLGDLVLTCTDDQSRNRRAGLALGRGASLEQGLASIDQVVEGVRSAREIHGLAQEQGVEMPIVEQVYKVLYEGLSPLAAVQALLTRDRRAESEG